MKRDYDMAIIGGGAVGSMVFLDAVSRGFKCVLLERESVGMQTTHSSMGLLQAGLNYLYKDRDLVSMNAVDCGLLKTVAPDFLQSQQFVIPVFPESKYPIWLLDGCLSGYDRLARLGSHGGHYRITKKELLEQEPNLRQDVLGGVVFYEWLTDPSEFTRAITKAGADLGGDWLENAEVSGAEVSGGRVISVVAEQLEISASVFINAAGPWAPGVLEKVFKLKSFSTRMTKGTSLVLANKIVNSAIILFDRNDKYIAVVPLESDQTLVGPTNQDVGKYISESPEQLQASDEEIEELREIISKNLGIRPSIGAIAAVKCGLRPQLNHQGVKPNDISHEFAILDHGARDGVSNLITVFGGKFSTQVRMAKETVDLAEIKLGRKRPWQIPYLRISRSGVFRESKLNAEEADLLRWYRKKRALSHRDDINKVALAKKIKSVAVLAPFVILGLIRGMFWKADK